MKVRKARYQQSCLLCGGTQFVDQGPSKCPILTKKFRLVKCANCGFVFVNPMPDEDEISKIYSLEYRFGFQSWVGRILDPINQRIFAADAAFITRYAGGKGNVIDIGYGSGEMLMALGKGWNKYGYDAYSTKKDRAMVKKNLGINALASTRKLRGGTFDLVILRNVIEHTAMFSDLFAEAHRLLKPNGYLFIRTPNIACLDYKIFGTSWYATYMGGHLVFFTPQNIATLSRNFGFAPKVIRPTAGSPPLSFSRSIRLKYSLTGSAWQVALLPLSVAYSALSYAFHNGNDILAIMRKTKLKKGKLPHRRWIAYN